MIMCGCGQPVTDASLCTPCTRQLQKALQAITGTPSSHGLAVDLDLALSRQGVRGSAAMRRGSVSVLPFDERASAAAVELRAVLSVTVAAIASSDASRPAYEIAAMATWLQRHIRSLRQHQDASEMTAVIIDATDRAQKIIDLPPERQYAGPCGHCATPLFVQPGAIDVTCHRHDPPWSADVAGRRDWMLRQVADILACAAEATRLLGIVGVRVTPMQISRWTARGRLAGHGTDASGRPVYRLSDIIGLATAA